MNEVSAFITIINPKGWMHLFFADFTVVDESTIFVRKRITKDKRVIMITMRDGGRGKSTTFVYPKLAFRTKIRDIFLYRVACSTKERNFLQQEG